MVRSGARRACQSGASACGCGWLGCGGRALTIGRHGVIRYGWSGSRSAVSSAYRRHHATTYIVFAFGSLAIGAAVYGSSPSRTHACARSRVQAAFMHATSYANEPACDAQTYLHLLEHRFADAEVRDEDTLTDRPTLNVQGDRAFGGLRILASCPHEVHRSFAIWLLMHSGFAILARRIRARSPR